MMMILVWRQVSARQLTTVGGLFTLVLLFIGSTAISYAEPCEPTKHYVASPGSPLPSGAHMMTMIAFGTSLMWGDGLHEHNTFRDEVADWISSQTGRPVQMETFAHSAALLTTPSSGTSVTSNPDPANGDLNSSLPSVDQQIECASTITTLSSAELILMEGCINDIGAESIVYPWTDTQNLRIDTQKECGEPMRIELQKIGERFPSAIVVVVGYYPLVSAKSSIFGFSSTRRLAKHATKIYVGKHPEKREESSRPLPRKDEHGIMVRNSEEFYQDSKNALKQAVSDVNRNNEPRFFFAPLPEISVGGGQSTVNPLFAYGARERHEWMVPIRFLHFWAFYKDQKYWYRQSLCKHYVNGWLDRLICDSNPAFHPNSQGATIYARSIEAVIPSSKISDWTQH